MEYRRRIYTHTEKRRRADAPLRIEQSVSVCTSVRFTGARAVAIDRGIRQGIDKSCSLLG